MISHSAPRFILTTLCFFLLTHLLPGQVYRFRNYGAESNLPDPVVHNLIQDSRGYLWIGTSAGLSRFDGFTFHREEFPDSSINRYPSVSFRDNGGRVWFGCSDGTIFYSYDGDLKQASVSGKSIIAEIVQGPDGFIYALPQRQEVIKINPESPGECELFELPGDPVVFTASFTGSGELLVGTQENLLIYDLNGPSPDLRETVEGFDYATVNAIRHLRGDIYIIGTDGNGLYKLAFAPGNSVLTHYDGIPLLETASIRSILYDSEDVVWLSTFGSGIIKLTFSPDADTISHFQNLTRESGLQSENVTTVFEDDEGNHWIGFFGSGLSLLTTQAFSYFTPGGTTLPNNIIFAGKRGNDYLLGTPSGYYLFDLYEGRPLSFTNLAALTGKTDILSYYIDDEDNIWIGTKGNGLYRETGNGGIRLFFRSGDSGSDFISDVKVDDTNIWIATLNGVLVIDKAGGVVKNTYNINNGLPHNSINQIYLTDYGRAYIAVEGDRLYSIRPDTGVVAEGAGMYGNYLNKILSVSQSSDGTIWAATSGNGLFGCYPDSVVPLTVSDGLMSNYCYNVFPDSDNRIWVGHERGFSVYDQATGTVRVVATDFAGGGACNSGAMFESPDGKILIGTTEGLIVYDRNADRKVSSGPRNNINYLSINNVRYPWRKSYTLPYRKRYEVTVNFVGIRFSEPERVYYSTFLENYNADWTDFTTTREVTYNLSDGKYVFNLMSVSEDGIMQEDPITFEIFIKRPFWRSWWFILMIAGLISGIIILIVREREKAQKKIQAYLESELEARTRVVMKQKAEIELQNIEITDSINYAKRIQSSILPDINKLKEYFSDAFIIFHPRDIVSGDFYWYDKFDEDKFILVCADSTGHGVPGAFMSMIGSTLLRDIVIRQRISKPSEILRMLDNQIFSTLNQNLELGVSNDGMDVIVCEFSLRNRHLRFASAMRPVILVMGGESYYIKGNRSSVGGESVTIKYFDDQEYYLNEGDTLYLFSDGLPDQFGGPYGKKMKIIRLRRLLDEISELPMKEQHEAVTKFYNDWKGEYEQVDDIIFMGVRI